LRFKTLPQYGSLAGGEHQRQFINEPLALSPNDRAIVLEFLRAIYNLEEWPRSLIRLCLKQVRII
jgi:hypothetical protein